jgi:hypothetical protein
LQAAHATPTIRLPQTGQRGAAEDRVALGERGPSPTTLSRRARVKAAIGGALLFSATGFLTAGFGIAGLLAGAIGTTACAMLDAKLHHDDPVVPGLFTFCYADATGAFCGVMSMLSPFVGAAAAGGFGVLGAVLGARGDLNYSNSSSKDPKIPSTH